MTYRKVFILGLLPLAPDYARTEDAPAQRRIHDLLLEVYESLPIQVERVPVLPPDDHVEFVLAHLELHDSQDDRAHRLRGVR